MLPLPPVLPDVRRHFALRLGRDWHVRVDTNDYSAHPSAIGRLVEVEVSLVEVAVRLRGTGQEVARHARSLCPHRTITHATHARAHRMMREEQAPVPARETPVEERDLASYDRAFGVSAGRVPGLFLHPGSENGSAGLTAARSAKEVTG